MDLPRPEGVKQLRAVDPKDDDRYAYLWKCDNGPGRADGFGDHWSPGYSSTCVTCGAPFKDSAADAELARTLTEGANKYRHTLVGPVTVTPPARRSVDLVPDAELDAAADALGWPDNEQGRALALAALTAAARVREDAR